RLTSLRLEIDDLQCEGVRAHDLVIAQDRRVADDIDAVELRLDDRVIDRAARAARNAEHECEPVTAIVNAVRAYERIRRTLQHDSVRSEPVELVLLDDGSARVLGDDPHAGTAADAI